MSDSFNPRQIGIDARLWSETGVGRYIRNLVNELQELDKENKYILFVLSKDKEEVEQTLRLRSENTDLWSIKVADIHWHTVKEQLQFGRLLEKEKLDLVHFPYFSVPIWYSGKFVLTIHDLILHQFPTGKASTKSAFIYWFKHAAYKYVIAQAAKKAERIITVSHATKDEIIKRLHVQSSKIVVTYEGVDKGFKINDKRFKNEYGKYFLYVGNAYPHKNLERLIEAFKLLICHPERSEGSQSLDKNGRMKPLQGKQVQYDKEKDSSVTPQNDIKLILVGKEDFFYKRLKKKIQDIGLEKVILFRHSVGDEELANLYSNALALVMPSLMEGFGLPIIEAMQQNCLVALSDIPVFYEIAKDAAIYFNPSHVQSIKNVLESIAKGDVPDESEKKKKGKQLAATFSWRKMAEETQKIYSSCFGLR